VKGESHVEEIASHTKLYLLPERIVDIANRLTREATRRNTVTHET
jgi:hypothetical protein